MIRRVMEITMCWAEHECGVRITLDGSRSPDQEVTGRGPYPRTLLTYRGMRGTVRVQKIHWRISIQ